MAIIPPGEKIIETKSCRSCGGSFSITDRDLEFYDKISPVFNGKKENIPAPTLCPDCRQQRRLSFRNERKLYKRKCDLTEKDIVSIYSPDKPYKVYDQSAWWGDGWDALEYGRGFDFSRSLFDQLGDMIRELPMPALESQHTSNENCDYTNNTGICSNCYLVFNSGKCQDCCYCTNARLSSGCYDCLGVRECENCFGCSYCHKSSSLFFSEDCLDCSESAYLRDCVDCHFCFDCRNLSHKRYCIDNIQYMEEEYASRVKDFPIRHLPLANQPYVVPSLRGYGNEDCTGDQLYSSKNAHYCYDNIGLENCKWGTFTNGTGGGTHNSYDFDYFGTVEHVYEVTSVGISVNKAFFSIRTFDHISDVFYSMQCTTSSHLFACVGLRHKQYCILNKQYTRDEYEVLVPRIIEHMRKTGEW
jgi:hypothetical protein